MVVSLGAACFGSVRHALGVASLTTGDLDRAVEHLRLAVQQNLALAHWPAVVTSRLRYAQALRRRAQPQDAATAELEFAAATIEVLADERSRFVKTSLSRDHELIYPPIQAFWDAAVK